MFIHVAVAAIVTISVIRACTAIKLLVTSNISGNYNHLRGLKVESQYPISAEKLWETESSVMLDFTRDVYVLLYYIKGDTPA